MSTAVNAIHAANKLVSHSVTLQNHILFPFNEIQEFFSDFGG
jgi:hypothetical protein